MTVFVICYLLFVFCPFFVNILLMFQKRTKIISFVFFILFFSVFASAVSAFSAERSFFIDRQYDYFEREKIDTRVARITNKIYFYFEKKFLEGISSSQRMEIEEKIYYLANEFEGKVYPSITGVFGAEDIPGIDNDSRLIVVFHKMKTGFGGYILTRDGFPRKENSSSNEGEIIYLNTDALGLPLNRLSYFLAHEFAHLVAFNQKEKKHNVSESTWFHELIAEQIETLLGYDSDWKNSSLKNRAEAFIYSTGFSLDKWQNSRENYAVANLFGQYLVNHYGINILKDSLFSQKTGVDSISEALKKNGYQEDFWQVFENWLVANVVNDCSVGPFYCYKHPALKSFSLNGYSYYLPTSGHSFMSVTDSVNNFSARWLKISGGKGILKIKWKIPEKTPIKRTPYVIIGADNKKKVGFLDFSRTNTDEFFVPDFGEKNSAVVMIPYLKNDLPGSLYYYSFEISTSENSKLEEDLLIKTLQEKIIILQKELNDLKLQIAGRQIKQAVQSLTCSSFSKDLYFGIRNSDEVRCLQQFLKNLGKGIYPEGLITGYFGPLTTAAVKRYQMKYNLPQTGYFGPLTRKAVNQEL